MTDKEMLLIVYGALKARDVHGQDPITQMVDEHLFGDKPVPPEDFEFKSVIPRPPDVGEPRGESDLPAGLGNFRTDFKR